MQTIDLSLVQDVIKKYDIRKNTRKRECVWMRYAYYNFMKKNSALSLESIGKMCGGKDHSTVLHGLRQYENQLLYDDFKFIVRNIERDLEDTITVECDFKFDGHNIVECLCNLENLIKEKL